MALTTVLYRLLGSRFRKRRMAWFKREFASAQNVLDVGGELETWHSYRPPRLVLLNVGMRPAQFDQSISYIQADGCALPLHDAAADVAFSNSVIEHVGSIENQRRFAQEMQRVGRRYYCQTPNKWFPLDTHSLGLLVHWLPESWISHLAYRYLTLQGWRTRPSREESLSSMRSVRHLSRTELVALFPGCSIRKERFLGMTKSFVAWR